MATRPAEHEVLALENRYWTALKEKDADAALELTRDPCIVTGAQGVNELGHAALAKMLSTAPYTLHDFTLDDVQVRMVRDDVAIVAYKVRESLTVEGKPVTLEAADTSTWVRDGGRWLCALHTEAITGDPFGRDRRAA